MEKTSARGRPRSNRYAPELSQRAIHLASTPSSAGFSGNGIRRWYTEIGGLANWRLGEWIELLERSLDPLDLLAHEALGDLRDELGGRFAHDPIGQPVEHA